ncbi:Alpha crystallin/Hsp20 domain, partial [Trinorchestia longiramus]
MGLGFNHGWLGDRSTGAGEGRVEEDTVTPGYHSLYRSLRAARMSYASQSTKFKEDGDMYKLVMDVREFVGGDVTVRTVGGTVSVRGKVDVSLQNPAIRKFDRSQERRKKNRTKPADDDSDTDSVTSGASTSTKTLHRRFTLPPDADGEKVRSILSKDAILTVTIPKRNDVRVIPVRMEGEEAPGEERGRSRRKRPSTSEPASPLPTKRAQAESGSRFLKTKPSCDPIAKSVVQDFTSREPSQDIGSKSYDKAEGRSIFINGYQKKSSECGESNAKKESSKTVHHRPLSESPAFSLRPESDVGDARRSSSARRNSKYEPAQEITIPVYLEENQNSKKATASTKNKIKIYDIKIHREENTPSNGKTNKENEAPRSRDSISNINESESQLKSQAPTLNSDQRHSNGFHGVQDVATTSISEDNKQKNPSNEKEGKVPPKSFYYFGDTPKSESQDIRTNISVQSEAPSKRVSLTSELLHKHDLKDSRDGHRRSLDSSKAYNQISATEDISCNSSESGMSTTSTVTSKETALSAASSVPSTSSDYSTPKKAFTPPETPVATPTKHNNPSTKRKISAPALLSEFGNLHSPSSPPVTFGHKRVPLKILKSQDQFGSANQSSGGQSIKRKLAKSTPSSPPLEKEVRVERRQSYMEDDLFKDCWRDYSNTLQDVLSRLQELSSELGQTPKFLVSSPNGPPSVPFPGNNGVNVNCELDHLHGQSSAVTEQPAEGGNEASTATTAAQEPGTDQSDS